MCPYSCNLDGKNIWFFHSCEVKLFLARICHDWDQLPAKMRKPMTFKDGTGLHIVCGMYLHFIECLERRAPPAEFAEFEKKLLDTFMGGGMDPELAYAAEHTVPPGDITAIGPFRSTNFARNFFCQPYY